MPCRVGMSTNPQERRQYWSGQVRNLHNWRILASGLTYEQALAREENEARQRGCVAEPGGPRMDGPVWSVYYFEHD